MLLAFEGRIGRKLHSKEPVTLFMPEYAAYVANRREVGSDGKTAHGRSKGKTVKCLGMEFGEKVLFKKKANGHLEKLEARWEHRIFAGVRSRSNEIWVAIKDQVLMVRSVKRVLVEQGWGEDCVKWVNRAPWNKYNGDEYADGDVPEGVVAPRNRGCGVEFFNTREKMPREFN